MKLSKEQRYEMAKAFRIAKDYLITGTLKQRSSKQRQPPAHSVLRVHSDGAMT